MKNTISISNQQLPRPPIVTILGHVDHGKTTLLDKIRNTNITAREAGGITQSIGAWQVKTKAGQVITFIDTPGHAAFSSMRERGAKVADVVVLVVAADDGVMPQTKESLEYIKASQTPFIVAVTKTDLATAQPQKAKQQLADAGVLVEEYGGDVVFVEVSAKTGKGVDELLEMIELVAQVSGLSGSPQESLEAYVIETEVDKGKGTVATVVVKNGVLSVGQQVRADGVTGKVRGLFDERQVPIKEALPGMPAEIIGFSRMPAVGSLIKLDNGGSVEQKPEQKIPKSEGLPVVIKADTAGSLEAILGQVKTGVSVLSSGMGDITESDIFIAGPNRALVVGFNVKAPKEVQKLAEEEKVSIRTYQIIYELLKEIDKWQEERERAGQEKVLGRAQITAQFPHGKERIAGCRVVVGRIAKTDRVRLIRGENSLGNVRIVSLKKQKSEIERVNEGEEFGAFFEPQFDFQAGDVLESLQS